MLSWLIAKKVKKKKKKTSVDMKLERIDTHLLHGSIIKRPKPHSGSDEMHRYHHFAILFKGLLKPLIEANGLVLQWIEVCVALG